MTHDLCGGDREGSAEDTITHRRYCYAQTDRKQKQLTKGYDNGMGSARDKSPATKLQKESVH